MAVVTETLVAMNYSGEGNIDLVLFKVGEAVVSHTVEFQPHWKTGEPLEVHRVEFDRNMIRNTTVHNIGFHAGFVVHVE